MDTLDPFRLYQVDTAGQLFISGEVTDWQPLAAAGITAVIDLDCKLDIGTPEVPNSVVYLFWPIDDRPELPDVPLLQAIARLGASLLQQGHKVLCQCGMGHNRSALVAGMILVQRGWTGAEAVERICQQREGALYNRVFRSYLLSLDGEGGHPAAVETRPAQVACEPSPVERHRSGGTRWVHARRRAAAVGLAQG